MGNIFKFGDNIDTDVIVPGKYLSLSDPKDLAKVCMDGISEGFAKKIKKGDVFIAGKNFGSGSSREHAPISIKAVGVKCIIAESFSRIFYRNSINIGLPVLESQEASQKIDIDDSIDVDFEKGMIINLTKDEVYRFAPYPDTVLDIINSGGYKKYIISKRDKSK